MTSLFSPIVIFFSLIFSFKFWPLSSDSFNATALDTAVELSWNYSNELILFYKIYRSETTYPKSFNDGILIYQGKGNQLKGVEADRNLENGQTYYYTLFPMIDCTQYTSPLYVKISPQKTDHKNFVLNGNFSLNFNNWQKSPSGNFTIESDINIGNYVKIQANALNQATLSQKVLNLKPQTLYTCIVHTFTTSSNLAPTFQIDGGIQQEQQLSNIAPITGEKTYGYGPKIYSYIDPANVNEWIIKSFVFWTGEEDPNGPMPFNGSVTLTLSSWKTPTESDFVAFSNIEIIEGIIPFYHPLPPLPQQGDNLIESSNFDNLSAWTLTNAKVISLSNDNTSSSIIELTPSNTETAQATQNINFQLAPNKQYTLTSNIRVDSGKIAYFYIIDTQTQTPLLTLPIQNSLADGNWHSISQSFTTPSSFSDVQFVFQAYKQQGDLWHACFSQPDIPATGYEKEKDALTFPSVTLDPVTYTFDSTQFQNNWLILNQKGSVPQNISFVKTENNQGASVDALMLTAYGNQATSSNALKGAVIATKSYQASGRYDIYAKIGPVLNEDGAINSNDKTIGPIGCCLAFWPLHYIDYNQNYDPKYYDEPNPIRNTEIDIEMPSTLQKNSQTNFSFQNGRLNTWGGQRGGDGGNIELHRQTPNQIIPNDGLFHQYTIVWHSGTDNIDGTRTPGFINWYIDTGENLQESCLWGSWTGDCYGFDNIPFRAARFYLGCWFPEGSYSPSGQWIPGWAGNPNWYKTNFYIEKITYSPLSAKDFPSLPLPNRDRWVPETNLNYFWQN